VVKAAVSVGSSLGLSAFVVGATMVAVGTSIPELAAMVVARIRREDHLGLDNILGSNIFTALFIVGTAAVIHPIRVGWMQSCWALAFAFALPLLTWPGRNCSIGRARGVLPLAIYATYLACLLRAGEH
jgi:cation:H+ antiporter